jgi:hypothetical protein
MINKRIHCINGTYILTGLHQQDASVLLQCRWSPALWQLLAVIGNALLGESDVVSRHACLAAQAPAGWQCSH